MCIKNLKKVYEVMNKEKVLNWASENGYIEIVKLLLNEGADVHADNDTALRWASENGHSEVVKVLEGHIKKVG